MEQGHRTHLSPTNANSKVELNRILELLPVPAYTCDVEGLITFANEAAVSLWGRRPKLNHPDDRYCGSFRLETAHGQRVDTSISAIAKAIRERKRCQDDDVVVVRPDETRRMVSASANPVHAPDGELLGFVNVLVDNTELKKINAKLMVSKQQLVETDRNKDQFLATLAHELRNSLVALSTGLELMRMPLVEKEILLESRRLMQQQLQHIVRLIDDLNDLSQVSRGQLAFLLERVDLRVAIQRAISLAQPRIDDAGHDFELTVFPDPAFVFGDLTRLTQVFANLLINAAKFTPPGGQLKLVCSAKSNEYSVSVHDDGIGITKDNQEEIFQIFSQIDRDLEWKHGGMGIGLSLAKGLVEAHKGSISVHSEGIDRGSKFEVLLPVAIHRAQVPEPTPKPRSSWTTRRVVVVDDEPAVAQSLTYLLKAMGHLVRTVHSAKAAMEELSSFAPDFVLCDIAMPECSGLELARRIRVDMDEQDLYLVACSGNGSPNDVRQALDAGFNTHLTKPLTLKQVEAALDEYELLAPQQATH